MARGTGLPRLTSLRLFAAAVVVVFHLDQWGVASLPASLSTLGYVGVAFFFTLSGLVLAWGTDPAMPAHRFYRHRFARVWPSHAVMAGVVLVVPVVAVSREWDVVLPNLLLIQGWWVADPEVVFGLNGVAWSLSCEAFFYACFPLTVLLLRRTPRPLQWALALAALLASGWVAVRDPALAEYFPPVRFAEFLLGVVAGLALRSGWRPRVPRLAGGAAVAAALAVSATVPFPLANPVMAVPFLVLLLSAAARDLQGAPGRLRSRWLVFGGEASFALYLVHEVVIINLSELEAPRWLTTLVIVVVAAAAAVALHLLVERPCNRLLRGRSGSVALARPEELVPTSRGKERDGLRDGDRTADERS